MSGPPNGPPSYSDRKGEKRQMDPNMVRIICAALAAVLLGMIVLRRKQKAE